MILVDGTKITTSGTGSELLSDAAIGLTEAVRRVSHKDSEAATAMISAVVATTVTALRKYEINIENDKLIHFIWNNLTATKE